MKSERGLGLIGSIFLTIIIAVLVFGAVYFVRIQYAKESFESLKTNMLLVKAKVKKIEGEYTLSKNEEDLKGTPIKDMQEDEIIKGFLEKNIIDIEEKDSKYYVLNQDDLQALELKVKLPENSYYVVNYTNAEIVITSGYAHSDGNTYYTLAQIESLTTENQEQAETENETNAEEMLEEE